MLWWCRVAWWWMHLGIWRWHFPIVVRNRQRNWSRHWRMIPFYSKKKMWLKWKKAWEDFEEEAKEFAPERLDHSFDLAFPLLFFLLPLWFSRWSDWKSSGRFSVELHIHEKGRRVEANRFRLVSFLARACSDRFSDYLHVTLCSTFLLLPGTQIESYEHIHPRRRSRCYCQAGYGLHQRRAWWRERIA